MPLNSMNLIYCNFHIVQIITIEDIDNIIKGALEVFLSVVTILLAVYSARTHESSVGYEVGSDQFEGALCGPG